MGFDPKLLSHNSLAILLSLCSLSFIKKYYGDLHFIHIISEQTSPKKDLKGE